MYVSYSLDLKTDKAPIIDTAVTHIIFYRGFFAKTIESLSISGFFFYKTEVTSLHQVSAVFVRTYWQKCVNHLPQCCDSPSRANFTPLFLFWNLKLTNQIKKAKDSNKVKVCHALYSILNLGKTIWTQYFEVCFNLP